MPLFNFAYFHRSALKTLIKLYITNLFYPLDVLHEWNKMYGPRGFYQYQSVVPRDVGLEATQEMLRVIKKSGEGSFLAVLKTFGNRESGGAIKFSSARKSLLL